MEEKRLLKRRVDAARVVKQNSEDDVRTTASWASGKKKKRRSDGAGKWRPSPAEAIDSEDEQHVLLQNKSIHHLRLVEPEGFEQEWKVVMDAAKAGSAIVATPYPVSWATLLAIQEWDQNNYGGQTLVHLTPRHFHRTSFNRMNVKLAHDVLCDTTARLIRWLRSFSA